MTPHEKAVAAINKRLQRLQAALGEAKAESTQRSLFQSIVVTLGLGEALNDYLKAVGGQAQRRHADVKRTNEALAAQHAELLVVGKDLLEKLKASPTDRAIRKEIEVAQRKMAGIQKELRRGTNALQRELAPSVALIDEMAVSVRRLSEAEEREGLKRLLKGVVSQVRQLYLTQRGLVSKGIIDAVEWEKSVLAAIEEAPEHAEAYARACYQTMVGLDLMTMAVSETPPTTGEEATRRAHESVAARVKEITARFTTP